MRYTEKTENGTCICHACNGPLQQVNVVDDACMTIGAHLGHVRKMQQLLPTVMDTSPQWKSKAMHKIQEDEHGPFMAYRSC
jgi:hypothetical protein